MNNIKRRAFLRGIFGVALAPLVITSKPVEKAIPLLKKTDRYCIITEYDCETGFREKRLKLVRYVGKKFLRVGDVVDYTDENSNTVTNCKLLTMLHDFGQLPRAGAVRITPEELEKNNG